MGTGHGIGFPVQLLNLLRAVPAHVEGMAEFLRVVVQADDDAVNFRVVFQIPVKGERGRRPAMVNSNGLISISSARQLHNDYNIDNIIV